MIYRSNETFIAFNAHKISAFNVSSWVTLFSITDEPDELAIDFVALSLLCSPLSDEADFETTLASSLLVAGRWEETPKKSGTLADDLFWDVSVWCFFFLSSDLWAPTLPCSKCQHPSCTRYIVPCACHPTSRSHSLYGDFWSHKLLKTHLPIVLNLSLVKQNANNQHQPKQGSTQCTWLFAERANSTKHFIGP